MNLVDTFATRDGFVPIVLQRATGQKLADDECDEPSDDDDPNDDAPYREFSYGEDAMVEKEDGELERGATDGKDAGDGEEELQDGVSMSTKESLVMSFRAYLRKLGDLV